MLRPIRPEDAVPYLEALGVRTTKIGQYEAEAILKTRDEITNHVGTMDAAAVFGMAECAAGALITKNFDVGIYTPLVKKVEVEFRTPVFGEAVARATVDRGLLEKSKKLVDERGRTDVTIEVKVYNPTNILAAEVEILFALRKFTPTPQAS